MNKEEKESEILINHRLDLVLAYYKRRTKWCQDERVRLQGEIDVLDENNNELESEIKDVSKQLEDFELLEALDDDRPSDNVRTDIDQLDQKLVTIDNFLSKKLYQEQNQRRLQEISNADLLSNQLSKNNTAAFSELMGNLKVLSKRLEDIGIKD